MGLTQSSGTPHSSIRIHLDPQEREHPSGGKQLDPSAAGAARAVQPPEAAELSGSAVAAYWLTLEPARGCSQSRCPCSPTATSGRGGTPGLTCQTVTGNCQTDGIPNSGIHNGPQLCHVRRAPPSGGLAVRLGPSDHPKWGKWEGENGPSELRHELRSILGFGKPVGTGTNSANTTNGSKSANTQPELKVADGREIYLSPRPPKSQ